ncbi:MAG: guanylate kinase [Patescibacteria group bacterium]|nr:guanylate kinase [Patescibacteria group bacterium]
MIDASTSPLVKLNDFKLVLNNYKPNGDLLSLLKENPFVLLSAPSAAGRNTVIRYLLQTGRYYFVISDTTRKPRKNNGILETNGTEYWFKSEDQFLDGLKCGNYVEAALIHNQQVSGINVNELKHAANNHTIPITDVDIQGCDTIMNLSKHVIPVFILPPKFDEWMRRLDGRGVMDKDEKVRRLTSAIEEIEFALKRDYFKYIINDSIDQTSQTLHEHITTDTFGQTEQDNAHDHAKELIKELKVYLANF